MRVKEAIILAAGLGKRMHYKFDDIPKPLIKIHNIPLITFPIANLLHNGVEKFVIVVNYNNYNHIKRYLSGLDVNIDLIINKAPERGNGFSLYLGMKYIKDKYFFLSMSDHIHHPDILSQLFKYVGYGDIIIGVDSKPKYINVDEATKVIIENNKLINIGKNIENYTHVDIGLFIINRELFTMYDEYCSREYLVELSKLIKVSSDNDYSIFPVDIHGLPWIEIDTLNDYDKTKTVAKDFIFEVIGILSNYINIFIK